jgi:hypothetical protein
MDPPDKVGDAADLQPSNAARTTARLEDALTLARDREATDEFPLNLR